MPRVIIQAFCTKCGCGNAEQEDKLFRIPQIQAKGYGITQHSSCRGCLCHGKSKMFGMPEIKFTTLTLA